MYIHIYIYMYTLDVTLDVIIYLHTMENHRVSRRSRNIMDITEFATEYHRAEPITDNHSTDKHEPCHGHHGWMLKQRRHITAE